MNSDFKVQIKYVRISFIDDGLLIVSGSSQQARTRAICVVRAVCVHMILTDIRAKRKTMNDGASTE